MKEWLIEHMGRLLCVGAVAIVMMVALSWGRKQTPRSMPCVAIEYEFRDGQQRQYVDQDELDRLLDKEHIHPVDQPLSSVALQRMEETLQHHPMIRTAECFLTPRRVVKVQLTQRVPLLQVQLPEEVYYIDTDRKKMEARPSITDKVLKVKGAVSEELAGTELADFAQWVQQSAYWTNKIAYVEMRTPQMMYIHLTGAHQPRVIMGDIAGFDSKLAKLHTFFEHGEEATKDKQYTELDLRFHDQVIGRK